ncbi:hypothetical protein RKE29_03870 [Streptomyces sp. B1866]|uniref:hypothetical protein n=1 Tax=Streptomyces sp. B1866 TaxID=3075431 RepID=UPI002892067B|nr:hypothetical protein [Streptomyces sp. B1866]MDT3395790.1 hypothetical protein [Streptomyces sp. B1866]
MAERRPARPALRPRPARPLHSAPADWHEWNERLAAAHTAAVARDPANRRLLEHPPGYAFTVSEVDRRRVSPPELATWTLISGHQRTFHRWKSHAQMVPWSSLDERFYCAILDARLHGRYRLTDDHADNVARDLPGYQRHCVAWHYLAPCWFAAAALATRTRCPGKSAALAQWRPAGLEPYAESFLRHASGAAQDATPHEPPHELLATAHRALDAALRHVPTGADTPPPAEETAESRSVAWTMAVGMLRVRMARWLYYLDPPADTATGYLIAREAKELRAAASLLRSLAGDEATAGQRLTARMADLLPTEPTTPVVLRRTLTAWRRHRHLVEDFLSLPAA